MSYRIVIYTKRKGILILITCIIAKKLAKLWLHFAKMHRTHAHHKFQPKWVCTLQLTTAHRNSKLVIAHRKSCFANLSNSSTMAVPKFLNQEFSHNLQQIKIAWNFKNFGALPSFKLIIFFISFEKIYSNSKKIPSNLN